MPARVLAPAPPRRPFPRWALWLVLGTWPPGAASDALGWDLVEGAVALPLVLGAATVGLWLEERYDAALSSRPVLRALTTPLVATAALVAGVLGAVLLAVLSGGLAAFPAWALIVAAWWFSGALGGSGLIRVIDRVVSAVARRFRTRVAAAVSALVGMMILASAAVATLALRAWEAAQAEGSGFNLKLDLPGYRDDPEATARLWREHPSVFVVAAFALALMLALPVVVSACLRLADAVMERVTPLGEAFGRLARGERDLQVEEGGSEDFVALARTFNQTVAQLATTERMERAFGVYVSRQVLDRIRAQHGDAVIPPALKDASVFFADIRGFTSMSERLAPAQVVEVLNRYFARVVPIIEAHEGYLNKFIGDAVVVVFNGPVDMADHAERAARCALALQAEVGKLNAEGAFPEVGRLEVGVGVATGPMVAGNVGSPRQMEYTVIGDTVNLSARLTSKAGPGEVWVSEATARALPESVRREALPPIALKGKAEPVVPWRLLAGAG